MYSDAWYWYTMHEWTRLAATDNLTIFRYIFSHNTALGLLALSGVPHPEQYGVCHGDELPLLFLPLVLASPEDRQVSRLMVDWWTNFAKFGDPTPSSGMWRPWEEGEQYLEIDVTPHMAKSQEFHTRMDFWSNICGIEGCNYGSGFA